jgi:streptogramin lyase
MRYGLYFYFLFIAIFQAQNINLQFKYFNPSNGLKDLYIYSINQDKKGFIWLGTAKGLIRFDGLNFKSYYNLPYQSPILADGNIRDIVVDNEGLLWLITDLGGISIFDPENEKFSIIKHEPSQPNSLGANESYSAIIDKQNRIWIAHINQGISVYDKTTKQFKRYRYHANDTNSLSSDAIQNIFIDRNGVVWIATKDAGAYYDAVKDNFIRIQHQENRTNTLVSNFINCITDDAKGNIWFGTDKGICHWNRMDNRFYTYTKKEHHIADDYLFNARTNKEGLLFFTSRLGLSIINPQTQVIQIYKKYPNALESNEDFNNACVDLFFDRDQNFWLQTNIGFGMSPHFINEIKPHVLLTSNSKHNAFMHNGYSWSFDGKIVVAKNDCETKQYQWEVPMQLLSAFNANPIRFLQGRNMLQAIAVKDIGIILLDIRKKTFEILPVLDFNKSVLQPDAFGLGFLDSRGNFWAAYQKDALLLYSAKKRKWRILDHSNTGQNVDAPNYISEFLEDHSGRVWASSYNKGIYRFELDPFTCKQYVYDVKNLFSPSGKNYVAMHEDQQQRLWIAGSGKYLDLYDAQKDRFIHFGKENAFDNQIFNLGEDDAGHLWVFSRISIMKFIKPSQINTDQAFQEDFTLIKYNDPEYIKGFDHAATYLLKDCKGVFYFANNSGEFKLDPLLFNINKSSAPLCFTDFRLFGDLVTAGDSFSLLTKSIPYTDTIHLNYKQNTFSISFALLSYGYASANSYIYMLKGLDKKWQTSLSSNNTVSYSKLEPGNYVFTLKAKNSDGIDSGAVKQLFIIIHPAFWQTWWFKLLLALSLGALIYLIYRIRINRILAQQRLRNNIARDLHDEVGSTLSSIAIMSEVVAHSVDKNIDKAKSNLFKIASNARSTLENMDDIIWAINPKNDSFFNLEDRIKAYLIPLCESKDIQFSIQMDPTLTSVYIDMQKRKNIYLILKEAINNAIKYSEANRVEFKCEVANNKLIATVQDNGKGFDMALPTERNGLSNMKKRGEELGADLQIRSVLDFGTIVLLQVPIR